MKKTVWAIALIFLCGLVSAQDDQKAKEILDQVTEKTQSYKSIEASFSFEMENKEENIKETQNGKIILKGDKYKVNLTEMGMEVYSDGKNIWTYMQDANEVSISEFDGEQSELMDPSKVFTIYQNGFDYKFLGEEKEEGKDLYSIDLLPKEEDTEFSKITVKIDKGNLLICSAKMYSGNGNVYSVLIGELNTDKEFNDSNFVFDSKKHPDVEVIDMR